ncbi:MAG: hypothetical protein ACJ75Q_11330 [Gaiellaceae bacterium]
MAERRRWRRRESTSRSVAHARTCSITGSSWREGPAIVVNVSKWSQNARGSTPGEDRCLGLHGVLTSFARFRAAVVIPSG